MTDPILKPCPFCGGAGETEGPRIRCINVACNICGIEMSADEWNTRAREKTKIIKFGNQIKKVQNAMSIIRQTPVTSNESLALQCIEISLNMMMEMQMEIDALKTQKRSND